MPVTVTNYSMSSGTLSLGSATFIVKNVAHLSGGTVLGPGTLEVDGKTALSGLTLSGARFDNDGTLTDSGTLTLGGASGKTDYIINGSGALFELTDGGSIALASGVAGTLTNSGTLEKISGTGVSTVATAVDNLSTITGGSGTLDFTGYLTNAGTVATTSGRVDITNTLNNKGTVEATHGEIDVEGQLINATAGYVYTTGAYLDLAGPVTNSGTIAAAGGTLEIGGAVYGTGRLGVAQGGTLQLDAIPGGSQELGYQTTSTGTIALEAVGKYSATISNFAAGDKIDLLTLAGAKVISFTEASNGKGGVLVVGNASGTDTLSLVGSYSAANFVTGADAGGNGTAITYRAATARSAAADHAGGSDLGRALFEAVYPGGAADSSSPATSPHGLFTLAAADASLTKAAMHHS